MEMEANHGLNYLVTGTVFGGDGGGGRSNSNCASSLAWDIWPLGNTSSPSSSRRYHHHYHDWNNNTHNSFTAAGAPPSTLVPDRSNANTAAAAAALVCQRPSSPRPGLYYAAAGGAGTHYKEARDPHLMCLKLGKRHYFEDGNFSGSSSSSTTVLPHQLISSDHYDRYVEEAATVAAADVSINSKRGKLVVIPYINDANCGGPNYMVGGSSSTGVTVAVSPVPRCQVQGCEAMLSEGKEYHRRHKVCETHSKAPKAMVLGLQQRFCQQCSRFHAVSEFDESKRSCRRRLAGHNERRRKSSHDYSLSRIPPQENGPRTGRFPHLPSPTGPALSLLSSKNKSSISSSDLSSRCSAALRELIAENRASIFSSRQLTPDKDWNWNHHTPEPLLHQTQKNNTHPDQLATSHQQLVHDSQIWDRFHNVGADANVTLNLAPSSAFRLLSMRDKASKEAEECSEFWRCLGGTHV